MSQPVPDVSVVIPAHNPRPDYLAQVLDAMRAQTLDKRRWELALVDNASRQALRDTVDLAWHPNGRHVHEGKLGLMPARLAGVRNTHGGIVVVVDDDNVLAPDFLQQAIEVAQQFPFIGTWSGRVDPAYETPQAAPSRDLYPLLTLREVTRDVWSNDAGHLAATPWGAGLCIRREVADIYLREVAKNPERERLDIKGSVIFCGGDTDIAYTGCRFGFGMGVFARLRVTHLIPAARCTPDYLARVAHGRGYSEVLHSYVTNGVVPPSDPMSLARVLRYVRALRKPRIERAAALAHMRGRRQAFRDLQAEAKSR